MSEFMTRRWLPGPPWLHFLILGLLLHLGMGWAFPEPPPVLGPPSTVRIDLLTDNFARLSGRLPSAEDRERLIDLELREELLFREAIDNELYLADSAVEQRLVRNMRFVDPETTATDAELVSRGLELNMHLTDEVIRRRMIQVMEQLLIAAANVMEPSEDDLRAAYERRKGELVAPAKVSFSHVFFGERPPTEVERILADIQSQNMSSKQALTLGTSFLAGFDFDDIGWTAVSSRLGREFAESLGAMIAAGAAPGSWVGPVTSVFGEHVVLLRKISPERPLSFEESRKALAWELKSEREQAALDAAVASLMAGYEVRRS